MILSKLIGVASPESDLSDIHNFWASMKCDAEQHLFWKNESRYTVDLRGSMLGDAASSMLDRSAGWHQNGKARERPAITSNEKIGLS